MTELEDFFTTLNFKGLNPERDYVMTKAPPPERIFLCGGNQDGNFRTKLHTYLVNHGHNLLNIENVLNWYAAQHFNNDLLELEKYFAALVSIIPIVSESMGSAAELGAFVNDIHIREKVYILIKKKHYSGKGSQSFIRYGPIKSYEKHVSKDGSGIYEIDDVYPEKDIKNIAKSIINHQSKQMHCDFKYGYFQVLLLADIINALVVCDKKEIKEHFKSAMKCAFPSNGESDSVYKSFENRLEEMLFVLEHLEIIEIHYPGKKYYNATQKHWFLDYRSIDKKNYKKINEVREQILSGIKNER